MKTKVFWCLVGVNLALAGMFIAQRIGTSTAIAQQNQQPEYVLMPGTVAGADRGVVYVLDTTNGMLGAMSYNETRGRIDIMEPNNLARVFKEGLHR